MGSLLYAWSFQIWKFHIRCSFIGVFRITKKIFKVKNIFLMKLADLNLTFSWQCTCACFTWVTIIFLSEGEVLFFRSYVSNWTLLVNKRLNTTYLSRIRLSALFAVTTKFFPLLLSLELHVSLIVNFAQLDKWPFVAQHQSVALKMLVECLNFFHLLLGKYISAVNVE